MIPDAVAQEITNKGHLEIITPQRILHHFQTSGLGSVVLIRAFKDVCEKGAGEYLHYGATTQDLLDTTLALRLKRSLASFESDLLELWAVLCGLARAGTRSCQG